MHTTVTKKGHTLIPAAIRRQHQIGQGDRLAWIDDGESIRVVPVPADPISALRGSGKGERLVEALLKARQEDCEHGS